MASQMANEGKGDALSDCYTGCSMSGADKMRFSSLAYEIIEELRMRRELDAENERRIQNLLNEKFKIGWKLEQEAGKMAGAEEKKEAELRETRRQLEDKMRESQLELSHHQVYRKVVEKEKEALKEEIRKLQMSRYSLEKQVREYQRQQKRQSVEREQHISQVARFEAQYQEVGASLKAVTEKQGKLEADMCGVQVKFIRQEPLGGRLMANMGKVNKKTAKINFSNIYSRTLSAIKLNKFI